MEVYGLVSGTLALLPLCQDGIGTLREIFAASTLELSFGRLELQEDKYGQWRNIWRSSDGQQDIGAEAYVKENTKVARRMLQQLAILAQILFDEQALDEKYGLKQTQWPERGSKDLGRFKLKEGEVLTLESQGIFIERCKANLEFIRRCKFALRRADTPWTILIDNIKDQIEILSAYGPKRELEKMAEAEYDILRKMELAELRRRADAATYEAQNPETTVDSLKTYETLALAAQFSVVVKFQREHTAYKFTLRDFRFDPAYVISSSRNSTMALLFDYPVKKQNKVVLIEWIDDPTTRDQDSHPRGRKITTLILATPKPDELLLPKCYGMVEDPVNRRSGLILAPPPHIRGNLPAIMGQGAISQLRMPVSLRELIEKQCKGCPEMLDLGIRFRLAKMFVHAVHMMFNVGWVHKNIRSSCILFFPAANIPPAGQPAGPASGIPQPIGYLEPMFVGLGPARVDKLVIPLQSVAPSGPPTTSSWDSFSTSADSQEEEQEESVFIDERGHRLIRIRSPPERSRRRDRRAERERERERDRERERRSRVGVEEIREVLDCDYYQHPEKRRDRNVKYSRAHDIYSLGIVLLELGLWKTLDQDIEVENADFEKVKRGALSSVTGLEGMTGSIYRDVVRKCLSISTQERTQAEARELSKFMADIAASLGKCCA